MESWARLLRGPVRLTSPDILEEEPPPREPHSILYDGCLPSTCAKGQKEHDNMEGELGHNRNALRAFAARNPQKFSHRDIRGMHLAALPPVLGLL